LSVRIASSISCIILSLVAFFFNSLIITVFYFLGMKNLQKKTKDDKRRKAVRVSGSDAEDENNVM